MDFAHILLAGVIGVVLYVALARLLKAHASPALQVLRDERDRLAVELQAERELARAHAADAARLGERALAAARLEAALAEAGNKAQREADAAREAQAALAARTAEVRRLEQQVAVQEQAATALRVERDALRGEHAEATAHLAHSERANAEMQAFLAQAQEKLSATFAELAGKTFDQTVRDAAERSRGDIETLLKPFAERVDEFRKRVDTLYTEEARERSALLGAVTELKTLNQDMAGRAHELTRALKGSAKVRGDWGELMLESVLRGSGLEEGTHYDRQKSNTDDEGQRLQPDIVVRLPDDRRIVVDSKVNLIAWQEAMNAEAPELQQDALRRHAVALRQHVRDLGERNYPKSVGESALEITIAFVPIEGALSGALGVDDGLQGFAFDRKVVFASPNTLMAVLRVVERLWTRDKIQKQAIDISDAGGRVLDALVNFLSDFNQVGARLGQAHDAFNQARNRLSDSTHAVIPRARRLAELGARGKRALPEELAPESPALALLSSLDPAKVE
jgi:DNA recombination protein RmuC